VGKFTMFITPKISVRPTATNAKNETDEDPADEKLTESR